MVNQRTILHNVNYFDAINGKLEEAKSIVLTDGKISWIGESSSLEKEKDDLMLDVEGKYILPGLIDCHVHLEMDTYLNPFKTYLTTPTYYYGYLALKHAQDHLRSGFTTVRDCGGDRWGQSLKRAFACGLYRGPRIVAAHLPIVQFGNQEMMLPDELFEVWKTHKDFVTPSGVDGVTHTVRDRVLTGSDFIKTLTTGGIMHGEKSKVDKTLFTEDELRAMVQEAHRNGLHVATHAHGDDGIRLAIDTGIDTIEHGSMMSEETAKEMIKLGRYLVPTHRAYVDRHNPETIAKMEPDVVKKQKEVVVVMLDCHRVAFEKGVKFALGTDSVGGTIPHGTSAVEIELMMSEVGMSSIQALQCATIEAAKAIQLADDIGSIEVGKDADIVVVKSNPFDDVKVLQELNNLEYVIKDAVVVAEKGSLV